GCVVEGIQPQRGFGNACARLGENLANGDISVGTGGGQQVGAHRKPRELNLLEALLEVSDDVADVLDADGQANRCLGDASVAQVLLGGLRVRGGGRVDDQGAYVTDVSEVGVQLQGVDELPRSLAWIGVAGSQV